MLLSILRWSCLFKFSMKWYFYLNFLWNDTFIFEGVTLKTRKYVYLLLGKLLTRIKSSRLKGRKNYAAYYGSSNGSMHALGCRFLHLRRVEQVEEKVGWRANPPPASGPFLNTLLFLPSRPWRPKAWPRGEEYMSIKARDWPSDIHTACVTQTTTDTYIRFG